MRSLLNFENCRTAIYLAPPYLCMKILIAQRRKGAKTSHKKFVLFISFDSLQEKKNGNKYDLF
jgi:hypothetical protein